MADVTLRHVYKVYEGSVRAVNDFDLEIKDKEFVVLVGPSGCGKSTTLRMVAGLESITSGQLFIDETMVNDVESKNRDIAMVFQSYALYPHMTVFQNMGFGLKLRHVKPEIIREKVLAAAEILEISDLLDRKPKELSGGQRQRVALGRAIVREPNVFLLDEPLSNLDAKLRVQMRTEITKLHEKLQTTFIYVTHDQTEAMTMGDTIVVMNKGYIQQADAPVTLFEDPANLFVATFLGSPQMNIIKSKLKVDGKKIGVVLEGVESNVVWLREETVKQIVNSGIDLDKEYLFGIRPDHVVIADKGIPAHVEVVEQLGDETIVYAKIEGHEKNVVIKAPLISNIKSQDDIFLNFNNEKVFLFDKDTEHSLIGMPSFSRLPCEVNKNGEIKVGSQSLAVDGEYLSHLMDSAFEGMKLLTIRPEHVLLEEQEGSVPLKVKVDFIEERTNYDIVYAVVEGITPYLIFRASKERKIKKNDNLTVYLPLDNTFIYDNNENNLFVREVIYPNVAKCKVSTLKDGKRQVVIEKGEKLVYDELPVKDGEYQFLLKQDKVEVVFDKKTAKYLINGPKVKHVGIGGGTKRKRGGKVAAHMKAVEAAKKEHDLIKEQYNVQAGEILVSAPKGQFLTVSCYDEEPQKDLNYIYAQAKGFGEYITLAVTNNFSVYKMPKFKIVVPADGFELLPLDK